VKIDFQRPFTAPEGAHEVILVRHGAVDAPAPDGLVGGRSDPPLNDRGREQADAVAARLADEAIAGLFVTPLRRTGETAGPLLRHHELEPVVLAELTEVYLGEWEGHGIASRGASADPEFLHVMREQRWDLIPGAEAGDVFAARVRAGLETVADAAEDGAVAVAVTHSAVIAELCRQVTRSDPFAFLTCSNGSITRLVRMPDRRWTLVAFNDVAHVAVERQPRRARHGAR
jgi:probable phosphoglycerate mutase